MGHTSFLTLAATGALLADCTPVLCLQPLYTEHDTVSDPRLAGSWTSQSATMQITPEGYRYHLAIENSERGSAPRAQLKARLVELHGTLYVDLYPDASAADLGCWLCYPMHLIGRLTLEDDRLRIELLDAAWTQAAAERSQISTASARTRGAQADALILLGRTPEIRALLENDADAPAAFAAALDPHSISLWMRA